MAAWGGNLVENLRGSTERSNLVGTTGWGPNYSRNFRPVRLARFDHQEIRVVGQDAQENGAHQTIVTHVVEMASARIG